MIHVWAGTDLLKVDDDGGKLFIFVAGAGNDLLKFDDDGGK
jgi:hypothetical protein